MVEASEIKWSSKVNSQDDIEVKVDWSDEGIQTFLEGAPFMKGCIFWSIKVFPLIFPP